MFAERMRDLAAMGEKVFRMYCLCDFVREQLDKRNTSLVTKSTTRPIRAPERKLGKDLDLEDLKARVRRVTRDDIARVASRLELDTVYTLTATS